jgi:WXG100 family type VII secretion target
MSDRITVTSQELRDTARDATNAGTNIGNELRTLMGRVEALTSSWTGQAASSFRGFYDQFNQGWSQVEEALTNISQMLNSSAEAYDQTETGIASQFGS